MRTFFLFLFFVSGIYAKNIDLTGNCALWNFVNRNGSVSGTATFPGGIYTDLRNARIIGDILSGFNDVLTRWVAYDQWIYTAKFNVSAEDLLFTVNHLVFEGLDTVAFIELNDQPVGSSDNMFVRYVYDVKGQLQVGENILKVTFISPVLAANIRSEKNFRAPACVPSEYHGECHANQLRKMQASFSWDWGPAFPSVGIWKPVSLELYNGAIIRSITTHTQKLGDLWNLKVRAHLETSRKVSQLQGLLSVSLQLEGKQTLKKWIPFNATTRKEGTVEVDMDVNVHENTIRLWWPNGYGLQPLYDLHVHLSTGQKNKEISHKQVKIGFRTIEVVEDDASTVLGNTTAGNGLTFYFKVNGYPLFMKGSNWIPAKVLPELGEVEEHTVDYLLTSARNTHMAMLRVWGGGVYESDYFYSKCDELGLLVWQDFMFACAMYPVDTDFISTVKDEIKHNVIRLQHHTSIAVWAGNNENEAALKGNWYNTVGNYTKYVEEYIKLYVDTIKPIVEELDPGRRYLVSSPSNGRESEREGYIARNPYDPNYGDTHYYNYIADNWDMNIYPKTRFASEYGFQSFPSIKTMEDATTDPVDFALDSKYSQHRQHSPNGNYYIQLQLARRLKLDTKDPNYFDKFVFYSQISQAMAIKAETEYYRQSQADWYTMGALYWQLNDIWQAPSWAGIEYGGRWKMLHYFAKSFFAPVLVSPRLLIGDIVEVYLLNDRFVPIFDAQIKVDVFKWNSTTPVSTKSFPAFAHPLSSVKQNITVDIFENYNKNEVFLRFGLDAPGVKTSPYNFIFPQPLKSVVGLKKPNIKITVSNEIVRHKRSLQLVYSLDVQVDTIVLFLWLETDIAGHFVDNGLIVTTPHTNIKFIAKKHVPALRLQDSIKMQYYVN